jgi:hypothetical protein
MQEFLITLGGTTSEQATSNGRGSGPESDTTNCFCVCRDITLSRQGRSATTNTGGDINASVNRPYNGGNPDDHWFDSVDRRGHGACKNNPRSVRE